MRFSAVPAGCAARRSATGGKTVCRAASTDYTGAPARRHCSANRSPILVCVASRFDGESPTATRERATMQPGSALHSGNRPSSGCARRGLLLAAWIVLLPQPGLERRRSVLADVPHGSSAAAREAFGSANELYEFKMPAFQQWLRENRLLRQPSEGDTDFTRRIFLALRPQPRYECLRRPPLSECVRIDRKISSVFPGPSPYPLPQGERGRGEVIFRAILTRRV